MAHSVLVSLGVVLETCFESRIDLKKNRVLKKFAPLYRCPPGAPSNLCAFLDRPAVPSIASFALHFSLCRVFLPGFWVYYTHTKERSPNYEKKTHVLLHDELFAIIAVGKGVTPTETKDERSNCSSSKSPDNPRARERFSFEPRC
eukprot:6352906-Amphidinium_carterae.1